MDSSRDIYSLSGGYPMKKRIRLGATVLGIGAIVGTVIYIANPFGNSSKASEPNLSQTYVGGDLHSLTALGNKLYVTGHEAAGVSSDGGKSWASIPSLNNADVMSWSKTSNVFLVGGHSGLYKSTDGGTTFFKNTFYDDVSDVHSIGATGKMIYLGSPQVGLLASSDGGKSWKMRNKRIGQGFMGSMLVDPSNPKRLIAPDMQAGLLTSSDGGLTWTAMGGPSGSMSVTWNPTNIGQIAAIGMGGGAISNNAGKTWQSFSLPPGSSALAYSSDGTRLYVATLVGANAQIFASNDMGKNWIMPSAMSQNPSDVATMDPNMPGMTNTGTGPSKRPLSTVLSIFGLGTSSVLLGATAVRRKDRARLLAKKAAHAQSSHKK
jgi:photosystem II stability/assembly factor-like uncharacterized protein